MSVLLFLVYCTSLALEYFAYHWSDKSEMVNINISFAYQVSVLELLFPPTVCHYSCLLKLKCRCPTALLLESEL